MVLKASHILKDFQAKNIISKMIGKDAEVKNVASIEDFSSQDIIFLYSMKYLKLIEDKKPAIVVTTSKIASSISDTTILIGKNIPLAHALIKKHYFSWDVFQHDWSRIHSTAVIHESVKIPKTSTIGPHCVIEAGVKLGEKTAILAGAILERGVTIGNNTIIHPKVVICYGTKIGNNVVIYAGSVIGASGFGFAQDELRNNYRIPQIGIVVVKDRVEIDSLCTIDRPSYGETCIHEGVVMGSQTHISHGCEIGENTIIAAQTGISGSSKIGKRVFLSGQTGILDHVTIPDDSVYLHRAGIPSGSRLKKGQYYAGAPVVPLQEYLRNMSTFRNLDKTMKRLQNQKKD